MSNKEKDLKLNKAQETFVELVIDSLEKERIPWNSSIDDKFNAPINFASKKNYQGLNHLTLSMAQTAMGTSDNRWLTFNQIKKEGATLNKGSKGVPVQFFKKWNARTKKDWSSADFKDLSEKEKEKEIKNLRIISRTATVFNASMVEGLPEYEKPEPNILEIDELAAKYIENLHKEMGYTFKEDGFQPYYSPDKDLVVMPKQEHFQNIESYNAVMIHEVGHATGHESRMNRLDKKGVVAYSFEELAVEISAFFQTNELGISNDINRENHVSYCQSWGQRFKDEPETIIKAVNESLKIKDYMFEKGDAMKLIDERRVEPIKEEKEVKDVKEVKKKSRDLER